MLLYSIKTVVSHLKSDSVFSFFNKSGQRFFSLSFVLKCYNNFHQRYKHHVCFFHIVKLYTAKINQLRNFDIKLNQQNHDSYGGLEGTWIIFSSATIFFHQRVADEKQKVADEKKKTVADEKKSRGLKRRSMSLPGPRRFLTFVLRILSTHNLWRHLARPRARTH